MPWCLIQHRNIEVIITINFIIPVIPRRGSQRWSTHQFPPFSHFHCPYAVHKHPDTGIFIRSVCSCFDRKPTNLIPNQITSPKPKPKPFPGLKASNWKVPRTGHRVPGFTLLCSLAIPCPDAVMSKCLRHIGPTLFVNCIMYAVPGLLPVPVAVAVPDVDARIIPVTWERSVTWEFLWNRF